MNSNGPKVNEKRIIMSNDLCIYHANCVDGLAAAWSVLQHYRECKEPLDLWSAHYGNRPPNVKDRNVIIVDFSYPRETLIRMATDANMVLVLDHHKTAKDALDNLGYDLGQHITPIHMGSWWTEILPHLKAAGDLPLGVLFDMERSGAGLAWDFFHLTPRPPIIDFVEDRDLWNFNLEGSKEIHAMITAYPDKPEIFDYLYTCSPSQMISEGKILLAKHDKQVQQMIKMFSYKSVIAGHLVPILNAPPFFASDAGNIMAKNFDFAAIYWDDGEYRHYSLRSSDTGLDVAKIAELYSGGGHKHAAGFKVKLGTTL